MVDVDHVDDTVPDPPMPLVQDGPGVLDEGSRPWWLVEPPPKKPPFHWPNGAKSPSWFTRMIRCPRNHAERYRRHKKDPPGLEGMIGLAVHGALEDAGRRRIHLGRKRPTPPNSPSTEELVHLLGFQAEIVSGRGTEVHTRALELLENMDPKPDFNNAWAVEHTWSFYVTPGLLVAGKADLIKLIQRGPDRPPSEVQIIDYKTGPGQIPSREKLSLDPQCNLQLIWAKRFFRDVPRIRFKYWNVTQNKSVWVDWSQRSEDLTLEFVKGCHNLWNMRVETPVVSPDCPYCPYRSNCKAYTNVLRDERNMSPEDLSSKEMNELLEIHYEANRLMKLAESLKRDAGNLIMERLGKKQKTFETSRFRATKKTKELDGFRDDADVISKVSEVTGLHAIELIRAGCLSAKPDKLRGWARSLSESKRDQILLLLEKHKSLGRTRPWIEVTETEPAF